MQPSSIISSSKLIQRRNLWIVLTALLLSVGVYAALSFYARSTAADTQTTGQTGDNEEVLIGIQPPSFQQISEFTEDGLQKLRLTGEGEAGAVIVLTNRGERLRQIRVDERGQWGVTLSVEDEPMAVEAQLYEEEGSLAILSEDTIFRIPIPTGEDAVGANYETEALIMITSPGNPSRLIQSPFGGVPESGPLSLSVMDYDSAGGIIITGTSTVPGRIRISAQDAVIGDIAIGVSGRWTYVAGRMLPRNDIDIRVELIAAQGIPNAPDGPISLTVPFDFVPLLRGVEDDSSGFVIRDPLQWQVRRTLIGGGGQTTVILSPAIAK